MGIANIISIFGMAILETQLINDRVTEVLTARRARSPGPESSSGGRVRILASDLSGIS